jgi:phosphate:Na+ symporter
MDLSVTLVNLAGSVALLLWGVHMVQTGVQRALGARLRWLLGIALRIAFRRCWQASASPPFCKAAPPPA